MSSSRTIIVCVPSFVNKRVLSGWLTSTYPNIHKNQIIDMGIMYSDTAKSLRVDTRPDRISRADRQRIYNAMYNQLEIQLDMNSGKDTIIIVKPKFVMQTINSLFGSIFQPKILPIEACDILVVDPSTQEDRRQNARPGSNSNTSQLDYILGKFETYTEKTGKVVSWSIVVTDVNNPDYTRNGELSLTSSKKRGGDGVGAIDIRKATAPR